MGFSYDLAAADATQRAVARVRLLIPDNIEAGHLLEDDEISYLLSGQSGHVVRAAAAACALLARRFGLKPSVTVDGVRVDYTAQAETFARRAQELQGEARRGLRVRSFRRVDGYSVAAGDGEDDTAGSDYA